MCMVKAQSCSIGLSVYEYFVGRELVSEVAKIRMSRVDSAAVVWLVRALIILTITPHCGSTQARLHGQSDY